MCAEAMAGEPWDYSFDVYSLGVVLFEIMSNAQPFESATIQSLHQLVVKSGLNPLSHYRQLKGFSPGEPTRGEPHPRALAV
jgi:hypothetical protein